MAPLPFLQKRQTASLIIAKRKPDGSKEEMHSEDDQDHDLIDLSERFIRAVNSGNAQEVASLFREAHDICNNYKEGSQSSNSSESNDFDSQNAKAAQEIE